MTQEKPIRVLVVDDHPVVRQGLSAIVDVEDDIVVVGQAWDGAEALRQTHQLRPDVVLMDLKMPNVDGVVAIERICTELPDTRVLVLTTYADEEYIMAGIRAGARGYLLKDASPDELVQAIHAAARGESLLQPTVAARVLDKLGELMTARETRNPSPGIHLTVREREVLRLLAGGARSRDVAETLFISERTVKNHVASAMRKLNASTRAEAVAKAIQLGLLTGDET